VYFEYCAQFAISRETSISRWCRTRRALQ